MSIIHRKEREIPSCLPKDIRGIKEDKLIASGYEFSGTHVSAHHSPNLIKMKIYIL